MKSPPGAACALRRSARAGAPRAGRRPGSCAESSSSGAVSEIASACRRSSFAALHSTFTPRRSRIAICASVSRIRGTFWSRISSSVSRQAARIGSAAFLLPAAVISPRSGAPPWITNFSVMAVARVKDATMADPTPTRGLGTVCEWVAIGLAAQAPAGRRGGDGRLRARDGGDEELWAVTGLVHDLDYERFPDLDDTENGHPRTALRLFEELRLAAGRDRRGRRARDLPRGPTRDATWPRRCSPSTSSRGSSPPARWSAPPGSRA